MRNTVGQTPRKKDYFRRDYLIDKIYRRLDGRSNVFLSAPRRVGKTAIMRHLQDEPRENYHFVFVNTEAQDSIEEFYRKLLEELFKSDVVNKITKISERSKDVISQVLDRINTIGISGIKIGMNEKSGTSYQREFEELLSKLEMKDHKVVILVDEFPQTVENIRKKYGVETAQEFLKINRAQRQTTNTNIQFILTGSIGLQVVVKQLGALQLINDLNIIDIPPLFQEEAIEMATSILQFYNVKWTTNALPYLLKKIHWLIPFHIQLAAQEIIDIFELTARPIDPEAIDKAFDRITHHRNDIYFDRYYSRLSQAFKGNELNFVLALLKELSNVNTINNDAIRELADNHQVSDASNRILESLLYDGYINNHPDLDIYRFNSSILKLWWKKYRSNF